MLNMKIEILKIIDSSSYPGWVECLFVDAWGNSHIFNEKIPIVTCEDIDSNSKFPQDGFIRCKLLKERVDDNGRKIITVSTENPDHVEAINGVNEFDLLSCQLTE